MRVKRQPWNEMDLKPPPKCSVNTQLTPADVERAREMTFVFEDALTSISGLKIFCRETSLLSRFLYRYKRAFRQDKGMQNLIKINQAIRRYEKINMEQVFLNFMECIPCSITSDMTEAYLPTRQMLKWVLLRTLTLSKVLMRIVNLSREAGKYLLGRRRLGWSCHYMTFGVALTGRIMTLAKYLLPLASEWYNRLVKLMDVLMETAKFISNFKFPRTLEEFVGIPDLDDSSENDEPDSMPGYTGMTREENKDKKKDEGDENEENLENVETVDKEDKEKEEKEKKEEKETGEQDEDDIIPSKKVFFRTVASNNGSQEEQKLLVEEKQMSDDTSDEEMPMFEDSHIVQPSTSGALFAFSGITSGSRSRLRSRSLRSRAFRPHAFTSRVYRYREFRYRVIRSRSSRTRSSKSRSFRSRALRSRACTSRASASLVSTLMN